MVQVRPLRLRLVTEAWADRVPSPAHDSLTPTDRRTHLALNPDSYMAVTRGLEDVLPGEEFTADELLMAGRASLDRLLQNGAFGPERGDEFYVYRLEARGMVQTAVVAGVGVDDYNAGSVRIHEHVKASRALHLAHHLDVVGVQSSPIAVAHRPLAGVGDIKDRAMNDAPLIDVTLPDGLRQTVWSVTNEADHNGLRTVFDDQPLYLIDGHHRAAAAATFRTAAGPGMADWMLCAIFAADELHNAPHHRLFTPPAGVIGGLESIGRSRRLRRCTRAEAERRAPDEIALYANGWYCLTLPMSGHFLDDIDPNRWQRQIVAPLFHLDPESDDPALGYLAGNRTLSDLEAQADQAEAIAVVMRAVPVDTLLRAADEGLVMPPKSTYFEPKVRSGVFIRATTE